MIDDHINLILRTLKRYVRRRGVQSSRCASAFVMGHAAWRGRRKILTLGEGFTTQVVTLWCFNTVGRKILTLGEG